MPYDNQSEYIKHNAGCDCENPESCSCESSCGCCPVGTVAVYDECGKHVGCLTPNDAAQYSVDTIDVPPGYVKVFDGDTYIGILTVADYCAYLECIGEGPTPETITTLVSDGNPLTPTFTYTNEDGTQTSFVIPDTVHIMAPGDEATGSFTEITIKSTDGNYISGDIFFSADRNGYTGAITLELISPDGIEFGGGFGTARVIPAEGSISGGEFEKPGAPLASGTYTADVEWRKADATVMRTQTFTFIVP